MVVLEHIPESNPQRVLISTESLHCDVMVAIMEQSQDLKSLINFTKASPNAFRIFHANQGIVLKRLLNRLLGASLPIAVARLEASRADWKPTRPLKYDDVDASKYNYKLVNFCNHYLADQAIKLQVPASYFTIESAFELWSFHEVVSHSVYGLNHYMRTQHPSKIRWRTHHTEYHTLTNELEKDRISKMLYITEIVSILLPIRYGPVNLANPTNSLERDKNWESFWVYFAPWEFCQYMEMQRVLSLSLHSRTYLSSNIHTAFITNYSIRGVL